MEELVRSFIDVVVTPLLLAGATAAGGWVVTRLPGPLQAWLTSGTHARDVALIAGAMARRALAQQAGAVKTASGPLDLASYVRTTLPEVLQKVQPTETALATMAAAAIVQASSVTSAAAAPATGADVLVVPGGPAGASRPG